MYTIQSNQLDNIQLYDYLKIAFLYFVLPVFVAVFINEVLLAWKMLLWYQEGIEFWTEEEYYFFLIMIGVIAPITYFIWFYYLVIQKMLFCIHRDFMPPINWQLAQELTKKVFEKYDGVQSAVKADLDDIVIWLNTQLSYLPKPLQWLAKKILDRIPLLEFVNSYSFEDVENRDTHKVSTDIANKINAFQIGMIESMMPSNTTWIIPLNLLVLYLCYSL